MKRLLLVLLLAPSVPSGDPTYRAQVLSMKAVGFAGKVSSYDVRVETINSSPRLHWSLSCGYDAPSVLMTGSTYTVRRTYDPETRLVNLWFAVAVRPTEIDWASCPIVSEN